ncbi:eukaryotic translation initiation factor 4G-like isoform X1 [Salvia splendens]|uniref:eukaryotic translation initiation factor 4G-like isoform X1 n=1 Tax=Salvia splendens TaxID=180675 RepID=UPI001C26D484|nr:eukaryotic translation initiation factor 4G-like isoform X1 [Salvia splendens]
MNQNQSRAERSDSVQYRKTVRSDSSNQQRQYSGGVSTKGGGGASSASTSLSNRSFKKYNNNAPVAQQGARPWNVDSSDSSAVHSVNNGAHQLQPAQRVPEAPTSKIPSNLNPTEASLKTTRPVPKSPSSNVSLAAAPSNVSSDSKAPETPTSGDASKSYPMQFGSISTVITNVMQIPARTSSAPPNLDEQKKDQERYDSSRKAPALPTPSISKQHFHKKDAGIHDRPNSGEAHLASRPKRDAQVSAAQPGIQTQRPAVHLIPNMPMQFPFHQQQIVQFGGQNPQIQSQALSGPMPIPMSLPLGNPSVQHSMFVQGIQPHLMQPQAMMHQGQGLNFPPQIGPQLPHQLGNMGMSLVPQFPQQAPVKYNGSRKTVKITHPETHEELRLDSSPAPRLHPSAQSQSQPISSFPPNMPMNFYPSSYNAAPHFYPPASSVPLGSTHVPPNSQPPRLHNQVTVKSPIISHAEKDPLPPSGSLSVGKAEASKPSRLKAEPPVSSLSSSSQPKAGLGVSHVSVTSSSPVTVERDVPYSASGSTSMDVSVSASTRSSDGSRVGASHPDSFNDMPKRPGSRGQQEQDLSLYTSLLTLPSQLPDVATTEAKHIPSESAKDPLLTAVATSSEASSMTGEGAIEENTGNTNKGLGMLVLDSTQSEPEAIGGFEQAEAISAESSVENSMKSLTLKSPEMIGKLKENPNKEVASINSGSSEHTREKSEQLSRFCSNDVEREGTLAVAAGISSGEKLESSVPVTALNKNEIMGCSTGVLVSPSPFSVKEKGSDANVAKGAAPKGKKKKKELYRKAEAASTSSDLYMAYKGPEEKKETITNVKSSEKPSSVSEDKTSIGVSQENVAASEKPALNKVEPDDWEDAAEISSPQLGTSRNENEDNDDGDGSTTKKYSRDFLLKFLELWTDLPEGFEITSDIADSLIVSSINLPRESYPSPGRSVDRHIGGSRPDRRGSGLGDEDKWNKFPGPPMVGRGDMWNDVGYMNNAVGFRPGQGGNNGVLRNPRAQTPQYAGGILSGPMQSLGPQGNLQRNNVDSDRWQRGAGFTKDLMPYPQTPMQVMHKAENKYEVGKVSDEEEAKQRQLKGILNKLTPQNFEKLFQQVKQVNIDNVITLSGVISQIFDKALMEPTFCEMYANFCFHLAAELPDLSVDNEKITFKRLLLNKCQEEFERGEREEEEANKAEEEGEVKQTAEEREEKRLRARRRMLGNIRLIGELYKKRMLTERIMHECINKLLGQYQNPDEENIEALCKLMSTIGGMIDHPKAKEHMDAYYNFMAQLSNNMKLSSRVRFMLKDAIDLRKNKWQQRRKVEGPKKIEEVHRDAAQERAQVGRLGRTPSMGNSSRRGPPMDFGARSPGMLSSPNYHISGFRGAPPQLRGYGSQDVRTDERHSSVPLPQRPLGDDFITLGPQGGLARGMAFTGQPLAANVPSAEMQSPGDGRGMGHGQNGFSSIPERAAYGQRQDLMPRHMQERFAAPPTFDQSHPQEQNNTYGSRDAWNDLASDGSLPTYPSPSPQGGHLSIMNDVSSDKVWPEEKLHDKSVAAIKEFYSARDEKEVALCIKDLNAPSFYPTMISQWVTDSFERKDMERDLLTNLLINLSKLQDRVINEDQLIKGFESVLAVLEDAVNDAPRAGEFLGRIFGKIILENVISLSDIGRLIYEGGEEQGQLVESGVAANVLASIFDTIKSEKGDSVLDEVRSSSNLRVEDFRPPGSNKAFRIDKYI